MKPQIHRMHKTKIAVNPFSEKRIHIDVEIFNLIKLLWRNKIDTVFCCQDSTNDGRHFEVDMNHENFSKFLSIMRKSNDVILRDSFSRVLWDRRDHPRSNQVKPRVVRNHVYLHAWVSDFENDKDSVLKIRLEIPVVLRSLIEIELTGQMKEVVSLRGHTHV